MANQFLNDQVYANSMLLLLKNQLVWGRLVDGEFKNQVTDQNALTINVKRPPRFIDKKDGTAALASQDLVVGTAPLTVNQYSKVHIGVGDIEFVTSYNSLMQNTTMKSAASRLAHSIDSYVGGLTTGFPSWVQGKSTGSINAPAGVALTDTLISTSTQLSGAHTRLMEMGVPNSDLNAVIRFNDGELIRGTLGASNVQSLNAPAIERARIPMISELNVFATQQLPTFTTGTRPVTNALIAGASQNVNYRDVKGTAGSAQMVQDLDIDTLGNSKTIAAGEVFEIDGVYAWDWRNQKALPYLQQFTVQSAVTSDASAGTATVSISPPIIVQGTNDGVDTNANTAFATVDSVPADDAAVNFVGTASKPFIVRTAFHKSAIKLVSVPLTMPFTGNASMAVDKETGIAIRYWRGSDIVTGKHYHRWDCYYGAAILDPFLGTRIIGS